MNYCARSILILFLLTACSEKKTTNVKSDFENYFEEVYSFIIPDTLGPVITVNSLDIVDDKYIYFTEINTSSLYKVDLKKKTMQRISRFGSGPGEFQRPGTVLYENDSLYVGNSNAFLNILSQEGKHLKEIKMVGFQNFIKHKNRFYSYSGEPSDYYFYSDKKEKIGLRPLFLKSAWPSPGIPGLFEHNDFMYFMNSYEAKIFRYNLNTIENEESIKIDEEQIILKGFIDQSWEKYYETYLDHKSISSKEKDQHFFWRFDKFMLNNEIYFYIRAKNPKTEKVDQFIVNQSGEIDYKFKTKAHENYYFKKSYDDKSIFTLHDTLKDVYYLKIYKLKKEFTSSSEL